MGYLRKRRQFVLVFEDEEFTGLEIRASSTSLEKYLDFMDAVEKDRSKDALTSEQRAQMEELCGLFIENVQSWNLQHEGPNGEAVDTPITLAGLKKHDLGFVFDVVFAWMDGVTGVSGPLARKSGDGKPSPEESIPMESL